MSRSGALLRSIPVLKFVVSIFHRLRRLDLAFHEVAKREGRARHVVMLRVSFLYVCVK